MFMRSVCVFFSVAVSAAACSLSASSPQESKPEPAGDAVGTAESATTSCGALREVCCANDVCDDGLVCDATGGLCRQGVDCGSQGEACCVDGRCAADLNCSGNVCVACGATGEACCGLGTDSPCETDDLCSDGTCVQCGGLGEACCSGNTCNGSLLSCEAGTCRSTGCIGVCGGGGPGSP
jgi:hypothetical protein